MTPVEVPTARIAAPRKSPWPWLLPLLALGAALWLLRGVWAARGPELTVRFEQGHGLRAGDALRTRGIQVGVVERITLAEGGDGVVVRARLDPSAAHLARAGTRLWVARPQLGPTGVSDLDTLVGPRYLALAPGDPGEPETHAFRGLERPPLGADLVGGLEVVLEAESRLGLAEGAPLSYRGLTVGQIAQLGLSADRSRIELRALIAPAYADLVRENTRFWVNGGFSLEAGLIDGLELRVQSLESLLAGGVSLATPETLTPPANHGARFELLAEMPEGALDWRPNLPQRELGLPVGAPRPRPGRAALVWKQGAWIAREQRRSGWCLRGQDSLIGPADLLEPPPQARPGSARLEFEGQQLDLPLAVSAPEPAQAEGMVAQDAARSLGLLRMPQPEDPSGGPRERERRPALPEDLLICGDPAMGALAIEASRLEPLAGSEQWKLTLEGHLSGDWHGAPVLARRDGFLIGCLLIDDTGPRIALLPSE
jgi:hypothetical protein